MPVIEVFHNNTRIDCHKFQSDFYILSHQLHNSTDEVLHWLEPGSDDTPGSILVWMQYGIVGTRLAFVLPSWKLSLAGEKLPQVFYWNLFLDLPFELTYHGYRFVITQTPSTHPRYVGDAKYTLEVSTKPQMGDRRYETFSIRSAFSGHALQQVFPLAERRGIACSAIYEVRFLSPSISDIIA